MFSSKALRHRPSPPSPLPNTSKYQGKNSPSTSTPFPNLHPGRCAHSRPWLMHVLDCTCLHATGLSRKEVRRQLRGEGQLCAEECHVLGGSCRAEAMGYTSYIRLLVYQVPSNTAAIRSANAQDCPFPSKEILSPQRATQHSETFCTYCKGS